MILSLNKASKLTLVAKSTLHRSLKNGDLSATKTDKGWQIEGAELNRWMLARVSGGTGRAPEPVVEIIENHLRDRIADKDRHVASMERDIDDLKTQRDAERPAELKIPLTDRRSFFKRIFG